jgi:hypothetical protein
MFTKLLAYLRRQHAGLLALFIALSGTSYAVATGSIDSREIRNNSVSSRDLRNHSAAGVDIRNGAIGSQDVRNGRLLGADVADGSLGGEDVRNGSLRDSDLGTNSVSGDEIARNSIQSDEVQNGTLRSEDIASSALASDAVVRFDSFTVPGSGAGGNATEDVSCASGERALGGGVSFAAASGEDPGDRVMFSEPRAGGAKPSSQGATATGWRAGIAQTDPVQRTANVWAICASR